MSVRTIRNVISGSFAFLAAASLLGGVLFAGNTVLFWTRVNDTHGTVQQLLKEPCWYAAEKTCVNPVVKFRGPNGLDYEFKGGDAGRLVAIEEVAAGEMPEEGQTVRVLYSTKSPQIARIRNDELLWGLPLRLFALFVASAIAAYIFRPSQGIQPEMLEQDRFRR